MPQRDRRSVLQTLLALPLIISTFTKSSLAEVVRIASSPENSDSAKHRSLGRNILRFINTAQAWHNMGIGQGFYEDINDLAASDTMKQLRTKLGNHEQLGLTLQDSLRFSENEIVPGWRFEFKVSADRVGYSASIVDVSGKSVGGFMTNELGVIFEASPLDNNGITPGLQQSGELSNKKLTQVSFASRIRKGLRDFVGVQDFICPCYVICAGEKICCYPCCGSCSNACNLNSGCACCVNVGCTFCVWCCGV